MFQQRRARQKRTTKNSIEQTNTNNARMPSGSFLEGPHPHTHNNCFCLCHGALARIRFTDSPFREIPGKKSLQARGGKRHGRLFLVYLVRCSASGFPITKNHKNVCQNIIYTTACNTLTIVKMLTTLCSQSTLHSIF